MKNPLKSAGMVKVSCVVAAVSVAAGVIHYQITGFIIPPVFYPLMHQAQLTQCNMTLKENPNDVGALVHKAWLCNRYGHHSQAIALADRALQVKPDEAGALNERSFAYSELGNFKKAYQDIDQAIKLQPANPAYYKVKGRILITEGKYAEALKYTNKALSMDQSNSATFADRAEIYYKTGRYKESIADLKRSLKLEPGMGIFYKYIGHNYKALGDDKEAQKYYRMSDESGVHMLDSFLDEPRDSQF